VTDILFVYQGYPVTIFAVIIAFSWLLFIWENYLSIRQRNVTKKTIEAPNYILSVMSQEEFTKARLYSLDKNAFGIVSGLYSICTFTLILYYGLFAWLWQVSQTHLLYLNDWTLNNLNYSLEFTKESEIWCSMLYVVYISLYSFVDSFPWSLFRNFVIEERYGFNKQTLGFFIKDKIKSLVVGLFIGLPITAGLLTIMKLGGDYFYLYAYVFTLIISLSMMFIYPEYIAPLFDRYESFPEGELRSKIEALAAEISFPLKKLLVVEGSKRSAHSNAYFFGFGGNKRIVLFDTLIKGFKMPNKSSSEPKLEEEHTSDSTSEDDKSQMDETTKRGCADDDEILAVLAHELGHWKLNHVTQNLIISQFNLLLMFTAFGFFYKVEALYIGFGFVASSSPLIVRLIVIFQFIFMPYHAILEFLMTMLSRKFEFQADAFSVNLKSGEKLKNALLVLTKDNLSFPVYDWLYSLCNLSHPPVLERLQAIDLIAKSD